MPWAVIIMLIIGALLAACIGNKEAFSFLYKLFLVFRMLLSLPIAKTRALRRSLIYVLAERLAEKHGVKL